VARVLTHAAALVVVGCLLAAVGQPIFTDDSWWHLALGRAYAEHGPWIAEDPLLFTAKGPPVPSAWLTDVALYGIERVAGFSGLRAAHVALVAAVLVLAWSLLRRAAASPQVASAAVAVFAAVSAYRFVQLRPHLLSMAVLLVMAHWLLDDRTTPSRGRVAAVVALFALWANLHAGFVLGPLLIGAGVAGLGFAAVLSPAGRERFAPRAGALAWAGGLGAVATSLNPSGFEPHRAYLVAGIDSPALGAVVDEWSGINLFTLPAANLPPSPWVWVCAWLLTLSTLAIGIGAIRRWRRGDAEAGIDPALLGMSAASMLAMSQAVRFSWLAIFPLLLVAQAIRQVPFRRRAWGVAGVALLCCAAFFRIGDWPMISRGLSVTLEGYARPYPTSKYFAQGVFFLADTGVEGRLFNEYSQGGFLGYWLAPNLRTFINGTLNVPSEVIDSNQRLLRRRGAREGESFTDTLDRFGVDVAFGIRLPEVPRPNRPSHSTTAHLESTQGWVCVFRNLRSAIYLRANARNDANLDRVSAYYAAARVPFDRAAGFEPGRVVPGATDWALTHGVIPVGFARAEARSRGANNPQTRAALERVASVEAALGLYDPAIRHDRRHLAMNPEYLPSRRRLVWSLLRARRYAEARDEADALVEAVPDDPFSVQIAEAAIRIGQVGSEEAAGIAARLPVFMRAQAVALRAVAVSAQARD
jgi:hypothetical protein